MPQPNDSQEPFVDRRNYSTSQATPGFERRQFTNSHSELTPASRELALAVDQYKLEHRRRFVTYDELMNIVIGLGYEKTVAPVQAQPVQAQPVQAQPVQAQPVQAQPVQAQPVQAQPVQAQPMQTQPVQA